MPIHVACAFDKAMAVPALIVASSIKQTMRPGRRVIFYAVTSEDGVIPRDAPSLLNDELFEFRAVRAPESELLGCDLSQSVVNSQATLLRLIMPDLLQGADRIIYLDCDVIVRHPLDELFDLDMGEHVIAACPDYLVLEQVRNAGTSKVASSATAVTKDVSTYFNAGIMLVDCVRWREGRYSKHFRSILLSSPEHQFMCGDQDMLNLVFQGDYLRLDPRWNALASYLDMVGANASERAAIAWAEEDPWIIHFCSNTKPWIAHHIKTRSHRWFWKAAEASPFHHQVRALTSSSVLSFRANFLRTIRRKVAEFILTASRVLCGLERRIHRSVPLSTTISHFAESLYLSSK